MGKYISIEKQIEKTKDRYYRNEGHLRDGYLTIQRECFIAPEVHEKMKKMPSGRKKLVIKKIPVDVKYREMIQDGRILVENCRNTWRTTDDELSVDIMACHLLTKIFLSYQTEGASPKVITYHV